MLRELGQPSGEQKREFGGGSCSLTSGTVHL